MRTDKKKFSTRLMTALMAGTLAVGMMGMSVSAADGDGASETPQDFIYGNVTEVPITKNIITDGNTYAPNATFNFKVSEGVAGEFRNQVVKAGIAGGLTVSGSATFTAGDAVAATYTNDTGAKLVVNKTILKNAGIYHYIVEEENLPSSATNKEYEGILKDNAVYDVYVYIYNDKGGEPDIVAVKRGTTAKAEIVFNNNYGAEGNDSTHDITITKLLSGNQTVPTDEFTISVKVNGATGEKYKVVVTNAPTKATEPTSITSGTETPFTVKGNTTIKIYGLTETDEVKVTETKDGKDRGYIDPIYSVTTSPDGSKSQNTIDKGVYITKDGTLATVTNKKDVPSPTGLILNYGPYILMIALAGSMAAFFFFKRNRKEA